MTAFESIDRLQEDLIDPKHRNSGKRLIITAGDSSQIEFIYLEQEATSDQPATTAAPANVVTSGLPMRIERVDSLTIEHGFKINCLRYWSPNATLYVSDTTQDLTIYDFNDSFLL